MSEWRELTKGELELLSNLLLGQCSSGILTEFPGLDKILIRDSVSPGCWFFMLPGQRESERLVQRTAAYVGDAVDIDGADVQALLALDKNGWPVELEIARLDGQPILSSSISSLKFSFVEE